MAAIRRTPTTIVGGQETGADLSVMAASVTPPWVFVPRANDNAPIMRPRTALWASVGIALTLGVPALLLVTIL